MNEVGIYYNSVVIKISLLSFYLITGNRIIQDKQE